MKKKLSIFFLLISLLLCSCANSADNIEIPEDAIEYNGHMYMFYLDTIDWRSAKKECDNRGGHLVTISSEEENQFLANNKPNELFSFYWIGATDELEEGIWQWVTGEAFSYTNWSEDSPNNDLGKEHYAGIMSYEENFDDFATPIGSWNDFPVITRYRSGYICEWEESKVNNRKNSVSLSFVMNGDVFSVSPFAMSFVGGISIGSVAVTLLTICKGIYKMIKSKTEV